MDIPFLKVYIFGETGLFHKTLGVKQKFRRDEKMKIVNNSAPWLRMLLASILVLGLPLAHAADKPNIVLVFMDNFGWGEPGFNGGGITRGAPTPRLDALAAEGMRLTNFNVETQCTPSRAAIMSGRYAIRTGNGTVPLGGGVYGLVQ